MSARGQETVRSVLFLIQGVTMPSSRVRVLNLLPELRQAGLAPEVQDYPARQFSARLRAFRRCAKFDAVCVQKRLLTLSDAVLLRAFSRRLVFDFDDAVYLKHESLEQPRSGSREFKFRVTVRAADQVIAGNRILAEQARRFNRRVAIAPSAVETRDVPVQTHEPHAGPCVIGWVGGAINLPQLRLLQPVLWRLSGRYAIELRVVSSEPLDMPGVPIRNIRWSLETEAFEVARFDIGVMPLPKSPHAEGKCGYKALQYMAAGVPPVVSGVGINAEIVEHGREGLVVGAMEGFHDALARLIADREFRRDLGRAARQKAEEKYSVAVVGAQVARMLKDL